MKQYTAAMATWYGQAWHIDYATETAKADETTAIRDGHALAALGAFVLFTMYVDGVRTHEMMEENGQLKKIN